MWLFIISIVTNCTAHLFYVTKLIHAIKYSIKATKHLYYTIIHWWYCIVVLLHELHESKYLFKSVLLHEVKPISISMLIARGEAEFN